MRFVIVPAIILSIAASAFSPAVALDLPGARPPKARPSVPAATPTAVRQGGDTIGSALEVGPLPFTDTGTTEGYADDYDVACEYGASDSPDVVYAFTPAATGYYRFDLCGSTYDTKLFLLNGSEESLACNDDYYLEHDTCDDYVSRLVDVSLEAGTTIYVVIDGYEGDYGAYSLLVDTSTPFTLPCPPVGSAENEPPLASGVPDEFNCGCSCIGTDPSYLKVLGDGTGAASWCLRTGWRDLDPDWVDQDWIMLAAGDGGSVYVEMGAEYATDLYIMPNTGCSGGDVIDILSVDDGGFDSLTFSSTPGEAVILVVVPYSGAPVRGTAPAEYNVVINFTGLSAVPNDQASWGRIKTIYR